MKISIEKYEEMAHPSEWFQYSSELFESSEILFGERKKSVLEKLDKDGNVEITKYGISRTYLLLIGFAIENVIKAKLITQNPQYIDNGKIDPSISKGHDLLNLANKVKDFPFTNGEKNLLKMLSEAIPYWGRYPIPKRWEMLNKEKIATETIRDIFINLYHRLRKDIYHSTRFGWKGPNGKIIGEWFESEYEEDISIDDIKRESNIYEFRKKIMKKNESHT